MFDVERDNRVKQKHITTNSGGQRYGLGSYEQLIVGVRYSSLAGRGRKTG